MRIKILALTIIISGIFGLTSCYKTLDLSPNDIISDQQLWQDQSMVAMYANNFYAQLPSGFNHPVTSGNWLLSSITDDAVVPSTTSAARSTFANPTFTANNSPLNSTWNTRYTYIRRANIYLANIDQVPGDQQLNTRLKAEVRFLRAYYYYDLTQWFGGVPIITVSQNINDSIFLPRNTLTECYDFIIGQLDSAAMVLPTAYPASDAGRITKQAAWALKCRVQMLKKDWTAAAATAKAIMELGVNTLLPNYTSVFTTRNNAEMLLSAQHNNNYQELGTNFDKNTFSPFYGGAGNNCPTQNLVDAYEMAKGKTFDPAKPYVGRDLRFYATILYDSVIFKNRAMQMYTGGQDINPSYPGNSSGTVTPTGYYLKKFTDSTFNPAGDPNARSSYNWPLIRYAEVLLNYAEAQNEAAGPDASIYDAVNLLRKRGSIAELAVGSLSQAQMRDTIRHERRIELAFEDFRYWDVKRWNMAVNLFSNSTNPVRKVTITMNPTTGVRTYTYGNIAGYNRAFQDKHYLFPVPQSELNVPGNKLTQNKDW